jgi:hypothetical protein
LGSDDLGTVTSLLFKHPFSPQIHSGSSGGVGFKVADFGLTIGTRTAAFILFSYEFWILGLLDFLATIFELLETFWAGDFFFAFLITRFLVRAFGGIYCAGGTAAAASASARRAKKRASATAAAAIAAADLAACWVFFNFLRLCSNICAAFAPTPSPLFTLFTTFTAMAGSSCSNEDIESAADFVVADRCCGFSPDSAAVVEEALTPTFNCLLDSPTVVEETSTPAFGCFRDSPVLVTAALPTPFARESSELFPNLLFDLLPRASRAPFFFNKPSNKLPRLRGTPPSVLDSPSVLDITP